MLAKELNSHLGAEKKIEIRDLANYVINGNDNEPNYCMLLGAGSSKNSGINTGADLVSQWRRELHQKNFPEISMPSEESEIRNNLKQLKWYDDSNEYSSLFSQTYRTAKQRKLFVEKEVSRGRPSMGHAYLVRLAEQGLLRTFFTTNFDDLVNEAFYLFSDQRPMVCAHDSSVKSVTVTNQRSNIIKLHGDYLFDGLKCTTDETNSLEQNMSDKFEEFLKEYGLIVAGYSGSDKSIRRILERCIESGNHLEQGLIWLFRPDDEVSQPIVDLLKNENCFFALVDGFDELCADLFEACGIQKNPFTAKSTETKVSQTTKAFLANDALTTSQNPVLKKHLSEIEQHQDSNALSNAIVQLQSAMQKSSTIPDKIITVLIEAQKHLYFRNFNAALSLLEGTGQFTEDPNIQSALLGTKLQTLLRMEQKTEAAKCADQLLELDCDNHAAAIKKAACLPSIRDQIESLEEFSERATAHFNINNEIAELCIEASQKEASTVDSKGREYKTIAKEHIEKSLVLNPRYNNYAYRMLLTLAEPPHANDIEKAEIQERVFNARYSQSPTSRITLATLHDICKSLRTNAYKNISVEDQAKKSFDRHYPKNRGSYFKVVSDICCEHENHKLLRYFYEMCEKDLSLKSDPEYISEKVSLQYDVYRDVESAISSAEDYCANHPHSGIEKQLFTLYLVENEHEKAQQLLERMSAYLIKEELVMRKARLFEAQSRYSDAIDALCTLENEEFFLEEYSSIISYYHLKNGDYENAKKSAQTLLEKHNFSSKFQTEIINYEFAKYKLGNKISKARIDQIISTPASIELEGVAKLLQNDEAGAIGIFKNEGRKRLSNLDGYLDWPALETIRHELLEYRSSLIKQRRTPDTALIN